MGCPRERAMARILVVNPNSNETVTRGLADALKPLAFEGGPEIVCKTLEEGPYGIESQADVESVVPPLRRLVEADNESDAFVIACFSDPGLHVCRDGAETIVMGCAGMARHRKPLEAALGVPVVDPTQAAVTMALGAVAFA